MCGILAAGMLSWVFASCGKKTDPDIVNAHYNYDLTEYIQVPEYKGLDAVGKTKILTEERIQAEIQSVLYLYTKDEPITDRGAETGDTAILSYVGSCEGIRTETHSQTEITVGEGKLPAEIETGIIGHKTGEEIMVEISYPDDYEALPDYAGKTVEYIVSIDGLYRKILPKYTDDFVRGYLGYDSIEDYENTIRTNLEKNYADINNYYVVVQIWQPIEENSVVLQYPEKELNECIENTIAAHKKRAEEYGISYTDYISKYYSMTESEFEESIKEEEKVTVKEEMICYTIARAENITITDAEYSTLALEYAKDQYQMESLKEFEAEYGKDRILRMLLCDKVKEWVSSSANLVESLPNKD